MNRYTSPNSNKNGQTQEKTCRIGVLTVVTAGTLNAQFNIYNTDHTFLCASRLHNNNVKGKVIPLQARCGPEGG